MKIIFVGGIQGVGKSTLLSWAKKRYGRSIVLLDPGELFRKYFYKKKVKTIEEIEDLIVMKLQNMPMRAVVLVHWHYAVKRPEGYISQVRTSRLRQIAKNKHLEKVVLLFIDAPVRMIQERRMKEIDKKKRNLTRVSIQEEFAMDVAFMKKQARLFARSVGRDRVEERHISNINLRTSKEELARLIKNVL